MRHSPFFEYAKETAPPCARHDPPRKISRLSVTSGTCTTSTSFRPLSRCSSIPSAQSERPSDRRHRPAHDAGSFRRSNGCTGCSYGTYQSTSLIICHPHRRAQSTFCPIFYLRFRKKYDIVFSCAETAHRSASDFLSDSAGTGIRPRMCAALQRKECFYV